MGTINSDCRAHPEQLLAAARRNPGDGLGRLLEVYRNYLSLLARTQIDVHLQSRVNPSDLVQEAFLDVHRDFRRFRGRTEGELVAWLRRILLHTLGRVIEQHVRAQRRTVRREVSLDRHLARLDDSSARFEAALASAGSSPSAQAERRERAVLLADRLEQLPPHYRDVIVYRNLEGLSFDETARRMRRPVGAVRMLWLRALDRLRRQLPGETLS